MPPYNTNRKSASARTQAPAPPAPAPAPAPAPPPADDKAPAEGPSLGERIGRVAARYSVGGSTAAGLETTRALAGERMAFIASGVLTVAGMITEVVAPESVAADILGPAGQAAASSGLVAPLTRKLLTKHGVGRYGDRGELSDEEMQRELRLLYGGRSQAWNREEAEAGEAAWETVRTGRSG